MSTQAQVESISLLKRLHAVLTRYAVDARAAIGVAGMEILHVQNQVDQQFKYWRQQVSRRQEEVNQARASLSHARAMSDDGRTGCVEQELALQKAMQKVREAEDKVAVTRRWQRELPEVLKEYEGPARGLSGLIESNLRHGLVVLEQKIASLEAYAAISAPDAPPPPAKRDPS
jgi:hypothetical protein